MGGRGGMVVVSSEDGLIVEKVKHWPPESIPPSFGGECAETAAAAEWLMGAIGQVAE